MSIEEYKDEEEFKKIIKKKVIIHLWADWCSPCQEMDKFLLQLQKKYQTFQLLKVEAEGQPEITEKYEVTVVPTFLYFENEKLVGKVEGANPKGILQTITDLKFTEKEEDLNEKLKRLINQSEVVLFMKGTHSSPSCKFSREMVKILDEKKVKFTTFDILNDEQVRNGLKSYSNWQTYPQLYSKGKLIGGLDIVKELISENEFYSTLDIKIETLNEKLFRLINSAPVMLFMKGTPSQPKCGFSKKLVEILRLRNVIFSTFDILEDEEVRSGLKDYSNWQTFPQLYSNGKLIGGLDIVKELDEENELLSSLSL
jgi:Grx4 family monothiol glutaredoxin